MQGSLASDPDKLKAIRAVRDILVEQLFRLEEMDETRTAADLSPAIERLNVQLGEAPDEDEIERLRRHYFMR